MSYFFSNRRSRKNRLIKGHFQLILAKRNRSQFFLPHIPYTYFGVTATINHPLYMQPNQKERVKAILVVEILTEVTEEVVVSHVVKVEVEVV